MTRSSHVTRNFGGTDEVDDADWELSHVTVLIRTGSNLSVSPINKAPTTVVFLQP